MDDPKFIRRLERWLALHAYGVFTRTMFRPDTPPHRMRVRFERWAQVSRAQMQRKQPSVRFEDHRVGALRVESVCAAAAPRCAILHLHGGAFVMGSTASYRNRATRFSFRCEAEVFVPDYRLAPEHPFPAALDDALAAFHHLRATRPGLPIFVSGDSAGGGLALSLLMKLRDRSPQLPLGAMLLSPWLDLSTPARTPRRDRWLTRRHLELWSAHYAASCDRRDPAISPLLGDLSRLPPLLVLAGEDEILLDDALRVVDAATRAGTRARAVVGKRMQHDFPLTLPWLEESRAAWRALKTFVDVELAARDAREAVAV